MKKVKLICLVLVVVILSTGCNFLSPQADRVSQNVSQEADNFNVIRRLTVINLRSDKPLFELMAAFSVTVDKEDSISKILPTVKIFIPAKELIDKEAEIKRLEGELAKLQNELDRSNKMLSNPNFLSKAAPEKIEAERAKLEKYKSTYDEVLKHLEELKK